MGLLAPLQAVSAVIQRRFLVDGISSTLRGGEEVGGMGIVLMLTVVVNKESQWVGSFGIR